eukprot:m.123727 g.123727  ORF g.123727 m.123727 type:complete len:59 (+) comp12950_c0_seq10:3248-3424(+)
MGSTCQSKCFNHGSFRHSSSLYKRKKEKKKIEQEEVKTDLNGLSQHNSNNAQKVMNGR